MVANVKDLINKATERANAPKKSGKPVFLFLAEGQKALIRPMFSLEDGIALQFHNKWSENADYRVNAVCASEIGKPCQHCESAKTLEDKKLTASTTIYVPVYVYSVIDVRSGQKITYTEKDEQGHESEKSVSGFRVLELGLYGKTLMILQSFSSYERDEDAHSITACDFAIEQSGKNQLKNFLVTPKTPKPIDARIQSACPGIDRFHEAILGARPPLVVSDSSSPLAGGEAQVADDDIPVF